MSLFDTLSSINYDRGLKGLVIPVTELPLQWDGPLIEGHHFESGRLATGIDAFLCLSLLQDAYLNGDLDEDEDDEGDYDDSWDH